MFTKELATIIAAIAGAIIGGIFLLASVWLKHHLKQVAARIPDEPPIKNTGRGAGNVAVMCAIIGGVFLLTSVWLGRGLNQVPVYIPLQPPIKIAGNEAGNADDIIPVPPTAPNQDPSNQVPSNQGPSNPGPPTTPIQWPSNPGPPAAPNQGSSNQGSSNQASSNQASSNQASSNPGSSNPDPPTTPNQGSSNQGSTPGKVLPPTTIPNPKPPKPVNPRDVELRYRNVSGVDLAILITDIYGSRSWKYEFPARKQTYRLKGFEGTSGWFSFSVQRYTDTAFPEWPIDLVTKNIFYSETPTLTVYATGNPDMPFLAKFDNER